MMNNRWIGVNVLFKLVTHTNYYTTISIGQLERTADLVASSTLPFLALQCITASAASLNPAGNTQPDFETINPRLEMLETSWKLRSPSPSPYRTSSFPHQNRLETEVEELCRPWHPELADWRPSHGAIPLLLTSPDWWLHGIWIHVVPAHLNLESQDHPTWIYGSSWIEEWRKKHSSCKWLQAWPHWNPWSLVDLQTWSTPWWAKCRSPCLVRGHLLRHRGERCFNEYGHASNMCVCVCVYTFGHICTYIYIYVCVCK